MSEPKDTAMETIRALPEGVSYEDIIEEIIYHARIEEGLRDADAGRLVPIEKVMDKYTNTRNLNK